MTRSPQITFELDKTTLVVVSNEHVSRVVPVTVTSIYPITVGILIEFALARDELSELILSILSIHNHHPLKSQSLFVGSNYSLLSTFKKWNYGTTWHFKWGEDVIQPSKEKWSFEFLVNDENKPHEVINSRV